MSSFEKGQPFTPTIIDHISTDFLLHYYQNVFFHITRVTLFGVTQSVNVIVLFFQFDLSKDGV